jgi:hypothetical protein
MSSEMGKRTPDRNEEAIAGWEDSHCAEKAMMIVFFGIKG